jgi:broad specificity phosphatase PhoE
VTGPARKLILVRHSMPEMVVGMPASQWHLSEEGRHRCKILARRLAGYELAAIVTSQEAKAMETGQIVAGLLGLPIETSPDLHEHEREVVKSIGSIQDFQAQVIRLFEHPNKLVLGSETADEAHRRFAAALAAALERKPRGNLAIVSHGTVMALFVSRTTGLDPVSFWKRLGLPAYAVLALPGFRLEEVVYEMGPDL